MIRTIRKVKAENRKSKPVAVQAENGVRKTKSAYNIAEDRETLSKFNILGQLNDLKELAGKTNNILENAKTILFSLQTEQRIKMLEQLERVLTDDEKDLRRTNF